MSTHEGPLGRLVPPDFDHVAKYPFSAGARSLQKLSPKLWMPYFMPMDQGHEGACVGFGCSGMLSILNGRRYDPFWLWQEAKKIDEWAGTSRDKNPNRGTSVRAAMDVLREQGHCRQVFAPSGQIFNHPVEICEGISENRWAITVDDVRGALIERIPVALGINWYSSFDSPVRVGPRAWVGRDALGWVRGGHCVVLISGDDDLEAVAFCNSWGSAYPRLTWMPYSVLDRLLREEGEACLVTDRPTR